MVVASLLESRRWQWWRDSPCPRRRLESVLLNLGCCARDLDRWRLEGKWLWLSNLTCVCVLNLVVLAVLGSRVRVDIHGVAWRWSPTAGAWRHWAKSGSVGGRLRSKLSKVQIRASAVTLHHGLPELPLGPESVEDNAVDGDDEHFDDDLDDAAHKSPVLKTANKAISDIIFKEMPALVVYARPAPHVLVVVLRFTLVEDCCTNSPHDDTEDEETDGEDCVVSCDLLRSAMSSFPIGNNDDDGHEKRDTGDSQKSNLRPDLGVLGPRWKVVALRKSLGGIEDGECCCDHGQDNKTAGEIDTTEKDLCDAHSDLDFKILCLLLLGHSLVLLELLLLAESWAED